MVNEKFNKKKDQLIRKARDIITTPAKRNSFDSFGQFGEMQMSNFNTLVSKNVSPLNMKYATYGRNTDFISDSSCNALTKSELECEYDDLERDRESQAIDHYLNQDFNRAFMTMKANQNFDNEDESINLLSSINQLIRDNPENSLKENVFGARAQSEQRALDKFHAPLPKYSKGIKFNLNQIKVKEQKARDMLRDFMQKDNIESDTESSSSYSESNKEEFKNPIQTEEIKKPDEDSLVIQRCVSSGRFDKQNKDDTLEYTMSANESNGGQITGNFGGTFSNFKFGNDNIKNFSSFRSSDNISKLIKQYEVDFKKSLPACIKGTTINKEQNKAKI